MTNDFTYMGRAPAPDAETWVIRIPKGIATIDDLFETFEREGDFPEWSGRNWNALSDCLRDFNWIEQRRIVIVHADVPLDDAADRAEYLDVLADAVRDWKRTNDEPHELEVRFPEGCRDSIAAALA